MQPTHLDLDFIRDAATGPGVDPRQWISFGTVDADTPDGSSVLFKDATNNSLPFPMVMVTLHPSGLSVPCRVLSDVAGNGEGTWYPWVAGDEVLVAVPQGDEGSGCVILGRLNQNKDKFPELVAGNDSTKNTFGFTRMAAPYILETAASYMIRSALTGSFMAIDKTGNLTLANGDNAMLHIGSDFLALQTGDNSAMVQVLPDKQQVFLQANGTQLVLDDQASSFLSTGTLSLSTGGVGATGHAIGAEQVIMLLFGTLTLLGPFIVPPLTPPQVLGILNGALPLAASLPFAPFLGAFSAALAIPPDPTGLKPGIAKSALLI